MRRYKNHFGSLVLALLTHLAAAVTVLVLGFLVSYVLVRGVPNLRPEMFAPTYTSENQSMLPAIINTCTMTLFSLLVAVPFGVGSAIYLVEYAKSGSKIVSLVRVTTETLSGIPSIVYGLFGMLFFSGKLHLGLLDARRRADAGDYDSAADYAHDGGGAALRAGYATARAALGWARGGCARCARIVLPTAIPGILSGVILAIGRIVGETAALMYTSGTVERIAGLTKSGSTLALHMYIQASEGLVHRAGICHERRFAGAGAAHQRSVPRGIAKMMMKGRE